MPINLFQYFCALLLITAMFGCGEEDGKKTKKGDGDALDAKVIYGDDNRLDVYQVQNPALLGVADSTVALIFASDLVSKGDVTKIKTTPYAANFRLPLCTSERFGEQETAAFCSGFLVAPNLVVTAGHCVQNDNGANSDCARTRFVFGFGLSFPEQNVDEVPSTEVYKCKRLVAHKLENAGADYALIELDRPVPNHNPLRIRRKGQPKKHDLLTVIGHPSGLPTKIAGQAFVRKVNKKYLVASLDTYGGNSGSAVFNSRSLKVEGILVRGEDDFVVSGKCMASKKCAQNGCRGEDVTLINQVAPWIPENEL